MTQTLDFPNTVISNDPEKANYQNYQAWQHQIAQRRREAGTQFNIFQAKAHRRLSNQASYKEELQRESEHLKHLVERRLSMACECDKCDNDCKSRRSDSDTSSASLDLMRKSDISLSSIASTSPPGTALRGPTSPSSKNSLIVSRPPTSRHHQRRKMHVSLT